jgi:hypothetical protein
MPSVTAQIYGTVRQGSRRAYTNGGNQLLDMNLGGDLLVAQGLPERTEIVRHGYSFSAQMPAASAFTLLITIPTTLADLSLQNGEASGGKSYVIERFWVKAVTSMASACALTPLSQLVPPGTAQVADNTAVLRMSLSGKSSPAARTLAKLVMASTATGCLLDKWNHHQSAIIAPTTNIGAVIEVQCYGRYIVPPQGSFNLTAQESVSGGTGLLGVEWHEMQLDLG